MVFPQTFTTDRIFTFYSKNVLFQTCSLWEQSGKPGEFTNGTVSIYGRGLHGETLTGGGKKKSDVHRKKKHNSFYTHFT